jgi:DNA (cytosine-5)-methyltransferase 1
MTRILNLFAGIGANRKQWRNVDVTAVENKPKIAKVYQKYYPDDKVIVGDAYKYLTDNYQLYDFIWASPPCQTHSDIRRMLSEVGRLDPLLPDMRLYSLIIFLKHFAVGNWCKDIKICN